MAGTRNGVDTYYIAYNYEASEQYIYDCASWARHFQIAASAVEEVLIADEKESILAYRVRFASGQKILALSSKPTNLRSRKGRVVIDEAAYHPDLPGLMKAAVAFTMWGGHVVIISTHNGVDNEFNRMVKAAREGELNYSLHTVTLADAIADGLFERICLMSGRPYSTEAERQWTAQLYLDYGPAASEELDCNPFEAKAGEVFNKVWFNAAQFYPQGGVACRFWDLATTAKEIASDRHFYTASTKMHRSRDSYTVISHSADQVGPGDVEDLIIKTAKQDGVRVMCRWEKEGGSQGELWSTQLENQLRAMGINAKAIKPSTNKLARAMPLATAAKKGEVSIMVGNDLWVDSLHKFDGTSIPLVTDLTDSASGAYAELQKFGGSSGPPKKSKGSLEDVAGVFK